MASLEHDAASGLYRIRFRFGGRPFKRSLETSNKREAEATCARVEENIRLVKRGRLEIPAGADPAAFLISDGKLNGKPTAAKQITLSELFALYEQKRLTGSFEENSANTERGHCRHLTRILGVRTAAQSITTAAVQGYVEKRAGEQFRGKRITGTTIKKEVSTLRAIWNWSVLHGHVLGIAPTKGIKYPKTEEKPQFQTYAEIKKTIDRDGKRQELWASLFLTSQEVLEVLELVRERAAYPFIYPMFAFVALTGARRSEMLRSRIEDIDFDAGVIRIREKKRDKTKNVTFRHVDMHPLLRQVLTDGLKKHPGGPFTITQTLKTPRGKTRPEFVPLTIDEANHHFKNTLKDTKWEVIKGFHVFRHSFASILAAGGTDQRVIDGFLGHTTEEMRKRYRHLFPDQRRQAIESVFAS